jgi:hypothetical protein
LRIQGCDLLIAVVRHKIKSGLIAMRALGFLLGVFMIAGAFLHNSTVSDVRDMLPPEKLFLLVLRDSILALPLIVPWRVVSWPMLWWPLFIILCFDVAAMLYRGVSGSIWAFRHGDGMQQLMFPLVGILFVFILAAQVSAVLRLRRTSTDCAGERSLARIPARSDSLSSIRQLSAEPVAGSDGG